MSSASREFDAAMLDVVDRALLEAAQRFTIAAVRQPVPVARLGAEERGAWDLRSEYIALETNG